MNAVPEKSIIIKQITIPCSFGGKSSTLKVYIGEPKSDSPHPLHHQLKWTQDRNGVIPAPLLKSMADIYKISQKNKLNFPNLFSYAMKMAEHKKTLLKKDSSGKPSA